MTATVPLGDSIKGQAKEGVERLLLAPVFLLYEIVAVLCPGVLFIVLLLAKGNHSVITAFQSSLFGYKTKIAIGLLLGYVIGKTFNIPADSLRQFLGERFTKAMQQPGSKQLQDATRKFVGGALLLQGLFANEHALNYLMLNLTTVTFNVSVGAVLLVSSLIPGDPFRLLEGIVGFIFVIRGYYGYESHFGMLVSMFGLSLSGHFQKLVAGDSMTAYVKVMSNLGLVSNEAKPQVPPANKTSAAPVSTPSPAETKS